MSVAKQQEIENGLNKMRTDLKQLGKNELNDKVVPEIINGRTMVPVRFIAENLGCSVNWESTTKTITITYQEE